jgi:P4 family phage/plasmid primase-like protien
VLQILRERVFKEGERPLFVFTEPPILVPTMGVLFKQWQAILKQLPEEEHYNLFYTLGHHAGASQATKAQRTKSSFEFQTVLPFDLDKGVDVTRPLEYSGVIAKFLQAPPEAMIVVVSGNGVHVLVNLRDPIKSSATFETLRPAYKMCVERLNDQFKALGLPGEADPSVWDPARVLRLPGSMNKKPDKEPKLCTLIQHSEAALSIDIEELSGVTLAKRENVAPEEIRRKYPTPDFAEMVKECEFVKWAINNVEEVHEPQAFDLFSILAPQPKDSEVETEKGVFTPQGLGNWVYDHAKGSASLKKQAFEDKWKQAKAYGGRKCSTIGNHWIGGCEKCPHFGRIPTPLALKSPDHLGSESLGFWVLNQKGAHQHPHYEDLAKVYRGENFFVIISPDRLFVFNGTHYVENHDLALKGWIEKKVKPSEPLREAHRNEFVHKLRAIGALSLEEERKLFTTALEGKINVGNGILDVSTGALIPHNSDFGFKYVLPYDYKPGLKSEYFLDWLATVTQDRVELMDAILDVLAYCLWPSYDDHLFTYFVGEGANGKSTLLNVLRALVGEANFSAVSLQQLGSNRFAAASLEGKLVNISGESSDHEMAVAEMNIIKELSSGEVTQIERKQEHPFAFKNYAKLVFSANKPPRFQEHGHALKRRLLVIPFDHIIAAPDSRVEERLIEEVPAIMSMLVTRIQENIKKNGGRYLVYRGGTPGHEAQRKILEQGNSVVEWAKEAVESSATLDEDRWITVEDAYAQYRTWIAENGYKHFKNKIWFGRDMIDFVITPAVGQVGFARVNGKVTRVYKRTRFKGAEECSASV